MSSGIYSRFKTSVSEWYAKPDVKKGIGTAGIVSGLAFTLLAVALVAMKSKGINPFKNSALLSGLVKPESIAMFGAYGVVAAKGGLSLRIKSKVDDGLTSGDLDNPEPPIRTWEVSAKTGVEAFAVVLGTAAFAAFAYYAARFLKGNISGTGALISGGGLLFYSMTTFETGLGAERPEPGELTPKFGRALSKAAIGIGVISILLAGTGLGIHHFTGAGQVTVFSNITKIAPASMSGLAIWGVWSIWSGRDGLKAADKLEEHRQTLHKNAAEKVRPVHMTLGMLGVATAFTLSALQIWGVVDSRSLLRLTGLQIPGDLVTTSGVLFYTMGAGIGGAQLLAHAKKWEAA